jgi:hypothetical protein
MSRHGGLALDRLIFALEWLAFRLRTPWYFLAAGRGFLLVPSPNHRRWLSPDVRGRGRAVHLRHDLRDLRDRAGELRVFLLRGEPSVLLRFDEHLLRDGGRSDRGLRIELPLLPLMR